MSDVVSVLVGRRLRLRRKLLGKSQQDLARVCGITFQQVQKYESAYCRLSVSMLWKLACALEVDIGFFFEGLPQDLDLDAGRRRRTRRPVAVEVEPPRCGLA